MEMIQLQIKYYSLGPFMAGDDVRANLGPPSQSIMFLISSQCSLLHPGSISVRPVRKFVFTRDSSVLFRALPLFSNTTRIKRILCIVFIN